MSLPDWRQDSEGEERYQSRLAAMHRNSGKVEQSFISLHSGI